MKSLAPFLLVLAVGCASTKDVVSEEVMMSRWNEFMTPGAGHAALAPRIGTWNLKVRMFAAPGAPAQESTGTSTMQWILDGRYLEDVTTGEFGGQTFHGRGLVGFDNLRKEYVGTWIDNFGTGIMHSTGTYDAATRTFSFTGEMPEFSYANDYVANRSTERWTDGDHWVMESFTPAADGSEFMSMQIEYSRAR
jgi:hypothetical protein